MFVCTAARAGRDLFVATRVVLGDKVRADWIVCLVFCLAMARATVAVFVVRAGVEA